MNPYLLQRVAAEQAEDMRAAAATARQARQARRGWRAGQGSPQTAGHLLGAIPRQREHEESLARRAA